jgi:hypothetical protein
MAAGPRLRQHTTVAPYAIGQGHYLHSSRYPAAVSIDIDLRFAFVFAFVCDSIQTKQTKLTKESSTTVVASALVKLLN